MKRDNINYLMVGSFVLLTVIGLMVFLYMVTGSSGPADRYRIQYRHVAGIKFGTAVYYEGYRVGQVEKITPEWEVGSLRYRVDISVIRDWEIPADSVARMMASGLLSAISIDIHQGQSRELLKPGGVIRGEEGGDIFSLMHTVALEFNQL
ncbi:MAG: MCE family protein, partial [Gammaproteobacteria bacterium]|nr:MCE family protein [Gammaproteobacteria bacterium]